MAAFTTIATTAIAAGMSGYQIANAERQRKNAARELRDYERTELNNAFENVQISTVGSDLMREETQRFAAMGTDAITRAGDRAILGGIPQIVSGMNDANREARKYLDDQNINRQYAIAQDNVAIRGMNEGRDMQNINALSSQMQAARQDSWAGMMGLGSALNYGLRNTGKGTAGGDVGTEAPLTPEKTSESNPLPSVGDSGTRISSPGFYNPYVRQTSSETYNPYARQNANPGETAPIFSEFVLPQTSSEFLHRNPWENSGEWLNFLPAKLF